LQRSILRDDSNGKDPKTVVEKVGADQWWRALKR
jgi:hypothetical protein